jgi:hypothetical protein
MASRTTESVNVDRETLAAIARDLDVIVASFDRIGSAFTDDRAALEKALTDFVAEWGVPQRLAAARRAIDDALLGPDGTLPDEEQLRDDEVWQPRR